MTSRQAVVTVDGLTHASSVIPVVSRNDAESGTITRAFVPLKLRALPNLPSVVHAAFPVLPVFPFPDVSATVVPTPSLNEYAAISSAIVDNVVSVTTFEYGLRLPAASSARTM